MLVKFFSETISAAAWRGKGEMSMAQLVRFENLELEREYVVIVTDGPLTDHCRPGYFVAQVIELEDADVHMFPCDRPLFSEH